MNKAAGRLVTLLLVIIPLQAVRSAPMQLSTERVVVFKDGYCLVIKKGTAKTDAMGKTYTDEVPDAAVLGSFWTMPQRGQLKSTVAGWVNAEQKEEETYQCTDVFQIVQANLGKQCELEVAGTDEAIHGTLLKTLGRQQLATLPANQIDQSLFSSFSPTSTNITRQLAGTKFIVRTERGDVLVDASDVRRVWIDAMKTELTREVTSSTRTKRLTFQFDQPDQEVEIALLYFRPGVRWIPTYRIDLTDEEMKLAGSKRKPTGKHDQPAAKKTKVRKARIAMQGELLNEAEDFEGVPIDVVVGVPNFRFKQVPSPMVLEATMQNLLLKAAPQIMSNQGFANNSFQNLPSNGIYSQRSGEFRSNRAAGAAPASVQLPEELSGQGGNDLYVYSLEKMSLRKGDRASVPIFRSEVPYRDVYTWDVKLVHSESYAQSTSSSPSPLILSENRIWRQVELINNTSVPWTTGAAMFMDGLQPLAQELLTYTSSGGICRVPVTVSVDLRGKAEDHETERTLKSLRWRGHDYARVQGQIAIELANNKTTPVDVEVKLQFGGRATKVTDDGKLTLEAFRHEDWKDRRGDPINNSSKVVWTTTVAPEECFEPTVDYEFFIRY